MIGQSIIGQEISGVVSDLIGPLQGAQVRIKGSNRFEITDAKGNYNIKIDSTQQILVFSFIGFNIVEKQVNDKRKINVILEVNEQTFDETVITALGISRNKKSLGYRSPGSSNLNFDHNNEGYAAIRENGFADVIKKPLSTFSVDIDGASYSNMRRFINKGKLPPVDAVRIEEMINYFSYAYEQPDDKVPFGIVTELSSCPWNEKNSLLHIGLQGMKIDMENLPASNIVFLLDVSGSMSDSNKLPLLKSSLRLLLENLREQDRVAIVVYAGSAGLVLPSTSCGSKITILEALEDLRAGGSTAGGDGLQLAYKVARENFIENGNNRIILATDGDFNVGISSNGDLERYIEKEREQGIWISTLGFGMGNYKDDKLELIANKGNGNYSYIDNLLEARKVLVSEFGGTMFTIAKDVKLQLEFNPYYVSKYRLIGYENRMLNEEDFDDDQKDAGDIGAGHSVTALYEIVSSDNVEFGADLKYQKTKLTKKAIGSNELVTVQLRYKDPNGNKSKLVEKVVINSPVALEKTSDAFRFSASVAEFGMLLRDSEYKGTATWESAAKLAKEAKGNDEEGYRGEMIRLLDSAQLLTDEDQDVSNSEKDPK
ncbi:MAG: YfbK domain-containing protein [Lutimonas sp.]